MHFTFFFQNMCFKIHENSYSLLFLEIIKSTDIDLLQIYFWLKNSANKKGTDFACTFSFFNWETSFFQTIKGHSHQISPHNTHLDLQLTEWYCSGKNISDGKQQSINTYTCILYIIPVCILHVYILTMFIMRIKRRGNPSPSKKYSIF